MLNEKEISFFKSLNTTFKTTTINDNDNKNNFIDENQRGWEYLAGRWAAKESIYKAIGDQDRSRLNFQTIQILNKPNGKPYVNLLEPTKSYFKELGIDKIHISISHDTDYATSNVLLESYGCSCSIHSTKNDNKTTTTTTMTYSNSNNKN